jgi:hypothetical protein
VEGGAWIVRDRGPGLAPDRVLQLFAVDRHLSTTRLIRKPTRGALGNGLRVVMGAIASSGGGGELVVTSRGWRQKLSVDENSGETTSEKIAVPDGVGTTVEIRFGPLLPSDYGADSWAWTAVGLARESDNYSGSSSPWWYNAESLCYLFKVQSSTFSNVTVSEIVDLAFELEWDDYREARSLSLAEAGELLIALREELPKFDPNRLPRRGSEVADGEYADCTDEIDIDGASIPCIVEAWATCDKASRSDSEVDLTVCVNGTPVTAKVFTRFKKSNLRIYGSNLGDELGNVLPGIYEVTLNLTAPYVPITTEGKEPDLELFIEPLRSLLSRPAPKPSGRFRPVRS